MAALHQNIERYLTRTKAQSASMPVREISVEALTKLERTLDWKTHVVSSDEFEDAKFVFDRLKQPAHGPSDSELKQLAAIFDETAIDELRKSLTKSVRGACACGRNLNVFDVLMKALGNSVHSVVFMKDVMGGERGKFLICGADGSEEDRARMPEGTIWVENTQPTECCGCGEPHQLLLMMTHMAHNWVLQEEPPEDPEYHSRLESID